MSLSGLYQHYRTKDVQVEAAPLTISNIRQVAVWIAQNGGSVAGMTYRDQGPLETRGIRIGTLEGQEILFGIGDYVVRDDRGDFFRCDPGEFHRMFDRRLRVEDLTGQLT